MVVAPARCAMKSSSAGSIIKSFPEMAYHDGSVCHATGPDGVGAMEKLSGICSAFRVASRVGVTVVNPSFWSPATTMSQPGGEAQAPWTRTIVGLVSELFARAVAGKTETISIAAMTFMSRSNRGLAELRAGRWACRANEAFIQKPSRGPIESRL